MSANVWLGEGVEVASPEREILDHGPVQRFALFAKDRHRRVEEVHGYREWAAEMTVPAITSSIWGSGTENGSGAGETITSSTPISANAPSEISARL